MADKSKEKVNIHSGHRSRMRGKIEKGNVQFFDDHELLEVLLYGALKRCDTNLVAHNLLNRFGSLKNVFSCDMFKLLSVDGVGPAVASFIVAIGECFRRSVQSETKLAKVDNQKAIKDFVRSSFAFENDEKFIMICADKKFKVLQVAVIGIGDSCSVNFSVSSALKTAILSGASFVVFAHNHINNDVAPSLDDIKTTKELVKRFATNKIIVLDHLITNGKYEYSFRDFDLFYKWFEEVDIDYLGLFKTKSSGETKVSVSDESQKILEYIYLKEEKNKH